VVVGVKEDVDFLRPVASCLADAGGLEASRTVRAGERVCSGVSVLGQVRWSWCWLAHYAPFLALVSPRLSVDISGAKSWVAVVAIGYTEAWVQWLIKHCSTQVDFQATTGRGPTEK